MYLLHNEICKMVIELSIYPLLMICYSPINPRDKVSYPRDEADMINKTRKIKTDEVKKSHILILLRNSNVTIGFYFHLYILRDAH